MKGAKPIRPPGRLAAWLLTAVALWCAVTVSAASAREGEQRGDFLWSVTVQRPFADVVAGVKSAAASRNFPVRDVDDYGQSFARRLEQTGGGEPPFAHYQLLQFCNVQTAIEALRLDLRMGVFMPCRVVVYQREEGGAVTVATVNPHFMAEALDNPRLRAITERVEAVVTEIFTVVRF